tara:strand:+ start:47 stop:877 length:831 start_codon:yes stop_codon:yes gene_type:complete
MSSTISYPFYFNNKDYQLEDIEVSKEQYNRWIKNCSKNITKSSIIYFDKTIRKKVCLIDGKLYCGAKDCIDYFHEVVVESEEVAKKYEEMKEWSISNFFAVENKTLPENLAEKWLDFCNENKGSDMLCDAFKEFNKRKEKIFQQKQKIEKKKEQKEKIEKEKKEKEERVIKAQIDAGILVEKEKHVESEEEEEEEEEYEYNACSLEKMFKARICVGGGGMGNGNANAYIEGEWRTEEEFNDGEDGEIFYCEYGSNPFRRYEGTRIIWFEDDNFNIE